MIYDRQSHGAINALCRGRAFAAIDPGKSGAAIVYAADGAAREVFADVEDTVPGLAHIVGERGVPVAVIEHQWLPAKCAPGRAARQMELAWQAGRLIGHLQAANGCLTVVRVWPATWQAHQRKGGSQLDRASGIELALKMVSDNVLTSDEWRRANKLQRAGIASAYGIGEWWRETVRDA